MLRVCSGLIMLSPIHTHTHTIVQLLAHKSDLQSYYIWRMALALSKHKNKENKNENMHCISQCSVSRVFIYLFICRWQTKGIWRFISFILYGIWFRMHIFCIDCDGMPLKVLCQHTHDLYQYRSATSWKRNIYIV